MLSGEKRKDRTTSAKSEPMVPMYKEYREYTGSEDLEEEIDTIAYKEYREDSGSEDSEEENDHKDASPPIEKRRRKEEKESKEEIMFIDEDEDELEEEAEETGGVCFLCTKECGNDTGLELYPNPFNGPSGTGDRRDICLRCLASLVKNKVEEQKPKVNKCPICYYVNDSELCMDVQTGDKEMYVCTNCMFGSIGYIPSVVYNNGRLCVEVSLKDGQTFKFSFFDGDKFINTVLPRLYAFLGRFCESELYESNAREVVNLTKITVNSSRNGTPVTRNELSNFWPWNLQGNSFPDPVDYEVEVGGKYNVEDSFIRDPNVHILWHAAVNFFKRITETQMSKTDFYPYTTTNEDTKPMHFYHEDVDMFISFATNILRFGKAKNVPGF
jgi:hypothetical protein